MYINGIYLTRAVLFRCLLCVHWLQFHKRRPCLLLNMT